MNVLIACEESQRVCIEFRKRGHRAFSCDLQECSGGHPEWHIQGDVLKLINGRCEFTLQNGQTDRQTDRWDLLIAHPPCTYLSNAGACRMYKVVEGEHTVVQKRYKQMLEGKAFFLQMLNADCDKIAVENPTPMSICELPKPSQVIQPNEFGHKYSKRTLLWLKGLPPLRRTKYEAEYTPYLPSGTSSLAKGRGGHKGVAKTQKVRSKTFEGIAEAMAAQWGTEDYRQENVEEPSGQMTFM